MSANPSTPGRIDVHHHILPPDYVAAVGVPAIAYPSVNLFMPTWSVPTTLEAMDKNGIATAVVSISAPGVLLKDPAATKKLARSTNQFAAQMVADHPTRFGNFSVLPLPDVKASLEEIAYVYDVLHTDGIGLMTNYADRYLGDPAFAPVFDELNRRKAVVFVHPNECTCNAGLIPQPEAMIEFPHDTTRTVTSLLFSGTLTRCPDVKFIFSHAGGTVPFLADRIESMGRIDQKLAKMLPQGAKSELRKLYYDTAAASNELSFASLLKLVTPKNIVMGTDFPFIPGEIMASASMNVGQFNLSASDVRAIERDNALGLFKRLAQLSK